MADETSPAAPAGQPPVYVSGGGSPTVTPDPVQLLNGSGLCQFVNQDPNTNYVIELWISNNSVRVPLCFYLPRGGTIAFAVDPQASNITINYNVLVLGTPSSTSRGGHGIIVGSGLGAQAA